MITSFLVYSIEYSEGLLAELPFAPWFVERSFSRLGDLRSQEMRIVLVTPDPVPHVILDYHLREVVGLDEDEERSARARLVNLSPRPRPAKPLVDLVLNDPILLERLRGEAARSDVALLVNFTPSQKMERLAAQLGASVEEGPMHVAGYWGSKVGSKAAFGVSGIPSCRGPTSVLFSLDAVNDAALELAKASPPVTKVVVKLNDPSWSAGIGNAVVDCRRLLQTGDLSESLETVLQPWVSFARRVPIEGAVVEEYVPSTSSPSGQGFIDCDGVTTVRGSHEQILVDGQFQGCVFPSPINLRSQIHDAILRVGGTLARAGARGTFGVDFLESPTRGLLATEINVRKLGPTHVMDYVESSFGDRLTSNGSLATSGTPVAYVHRRRHRHTAWRDTPPETALSLLRRRGLLFDRSTRSGAILHVLGALRPCGYLETTCVAASYKEAELVDTQVADALAAMTERRK